MNREELALLNEVISEQFGLWFADHKREILASRLAPRLKALHLQRFLDYFVYLQYDLNGERQHLARLITNNETYFFRETRQFDSLFGKALDPLLEGARTSGVLRCLSAGCSSGEEPYTLKVYSLEKRRRHVGVNIEIHAFDIDSDRLERAHKAEYGPSSLRSLSASHTGKYFVEVEPGRRFRLRDTYRKGVTFREGNIVKLPTYRRAHPYDIVFCRNVLIYFSEAALHQTINNFAQVLRPGGLLFLGHAESIIGVSRFFETVRLESCLAYRRIEP